eukprot:scaffold106034_cov30-Tisochrysis_lutea.AAC.3
MPCGPSGAGVPPTLELCSPSQWHQDLFFPLRIPQSLIARPWVIWASYWARNVTLPCSLRPTQE